MLWYNYSYAQMCLLIGTVSQVNNMTHWSLHCYYVVTCMNQPFQNGMVRYLKKSNFQLTKCCFVLCYVENYPRFWRRSLKCRELTKLMTPMTSRYVYCGIIIVRSRSMFVDLVGHPYSQIYNPTKRVTMI